MRRQSEPSGPRRAGPYAVLMHDAWAWLRRHPWETDVALAAAILVISLGETTADPLIGVVSLALAATVLVRRKYPVEAFAVAAAVAATQVAYGLSPGGGYRIGAFQPTAADIVLAVLLYTLAVQTPPRKSVAGLGSA